MIQTTTPDVIVWLIVGFLAGSLAGFVIKREKRGFGHLVNLALGLAGALIGGFLFDILKIDMGMANISVGLQDIVSAFVGSLIFLMLLFYGRRWYQEKKDARNETTKGSS